LILVKYLLKNKYLFIVKYDLFIKYKIMAFELPKLPYEKNALEPHISAETLEYHY